MIKKLKEKVSQRGAALVELIISILIVGLVLTALASTLTYSISVTSAARKQDIATGLAQDGIETIHKLRATAGWSAFYGYFDALELGVAPIQTTFLCIKENPVNTVDPEAVFVEISSTQAALTKEECLKTDESINIDFYQVTTVIVDSSTESVTAQVDVSWDVTDTESKHLLNPVTKIFREID